MFLMFCLVLSSFAVYYCANMLKAENSFIGKLVYLTIFSHLWLFLVGTSLFIWFKDIQSLIVGQARYWVVGYVALFTFGTWTGIDQRYEWDLLSRTVLGCTVLAIAFSNNHKLATLNRALPGDYSYGIYLFHGLYLNIIVAKLATPGLTELLLLWLISALTAALSWHLLEKPALTLKKVSYQRLRRKWTS